VIPKILHQTSKTIEVPEKWRPLQAKLKELHPGWEYRHWDDEANLKLLQDHRPDLLTVYESMPRPIMKADMIRYVYMQLFGGVYLDTDYEFVRPFPQFDQSLVLPRESADDQPIYLGNCVFGSEAGHPFWSAVLDSLLADPPGKKTWLDEHGVLALTGPGFLTRIYNEGFSQDLSILVPPKSAFHPPIPRDNQSYLGLLKGGETIGIHYCFGSWRALSLRERLRERLRKWGLFR
jgi:mannosyltransferase OCH1-like enzyme